MTDDLNAALNRAVDEPAAEPKKSGRGKSVEPDPALTALQAENAALKSDMAALREMVLAAMQPAAPAAAEPKRDELDRDRPFAKTRTMGGGVTFEQDGRRFDARGRLMAAPEA